MNTNIRFSPFLVAFSVLFSDISFCLLTSAETPKVRESLGDSEQKTEVAPKNTIIQGYEVPNIKARMQSVFTEAKSSKKSELLPVNFGGTSFTGLVTRLFGEGLNKQFEGLNTKQVIYHGMNENITEGLAHAATSEYAGQLIHTVIFYSPGGTIRKIEVDGISPKTSKEFADQKILDQFAGHQTEDFEVVRGRRGRVVSKGAFLAKVRRPSSQESRQVFEKVLRSVRFSAAFMDVAYFITQHPDQADKLTQEFPEGIQFSKDGPLTGPEAFVQKGNSASPIDGKPFHEEEEKEQNN